MRASELNDYLKLGPGGECNVIQKLSSLLVCGAIWLAAPGQTDAKGKEKDWITLDHCQLIPNKANDGDSFHVRANDNEYLVRLYFVDAPETASVGPARLIVSEIFKIEAGSKKFDYVNGGRAAWFARIDRIKLAAVTPARVNKWRIAFAGRAGGN